MRREERVGCDGSISLHYRYPGSRLNSLYGIFRGFLNRVLKKITIFILSDRVLVFYFHFYFHGRLRVIRTAKVCSVQTNAVPGSAVFSLGGQSPPWECKTRREHFKSYTC
jgi:hypothetical protein